MSRLEIDPSFKANYDEYYAAERHAKWRNMSALAKADNIVSLGALHPHASIIDIGCGDGSVTARLGELQFGEQLYCIDISRSGLDALKEKNIDRLAEAKLFDGCEIPYSDKHFDLAVLSHVVEHLEYPRKLLKEAARVARYVFVEVPLEHTIRMTGDYVHNEVGHINFYTDKTIRRLLQTSGLEIMDQKVVNVPLDVLKFQYGPTGWLRHFLREYALKYLPFLAKQCFVYHSALMCRSATQERIASHKQSSDAR